MADSGIPLSTLIAALRRELAQAKEQGQGHEIKLQVEEAEIELQVAITREGGGGVGVEFWVVNAEAKGKLADVTTQKIKLKLKGKRSQERLGPSAGLGEPGEIGGLASEVGVQSRDQHLSYVDWWWSRHVWRRERLRSTHWLPVSLMVP